MILAATTSFYFQGTAQFLQNIGVSGKNVSAAMSIAQAVQAVATMTIFGPLYYHYGPKWTVALGAGCWVLMYAIYVGSRQRWLIVPAQALHGVAYLLAFNAGWLFVKDVAPREILNSAQSLF